MGENRVSSGNVAGPPVTTGVTRHCAGPSPRFAARQTFYWCTASPMERPGRCWSRTRSMVLSRPDKRSA